MQSSSSYISDCNIQCRISSETYELYDCGFYDEATNTTHKTVVSTTNSTGSWLNASNGITVAYSSNGTTLTNPDGTTRHFFYHDTSITSTKVGAYNSILNNHAIEFDLNALTGTPDMYLTDGTNNKTLNFTATGHYKIVLDGSRVHLYKDGVEQTLTGSVTMTGTNVRVSFLLNAADESLTFKQFMVYPI